MPDYWCSTCGRRTGMMGHKCPELKSTNRLNNDWEQIAKRMAKFDEIVKRACRERDDLAEFVANHAYDEDFADKVWERFEDLLLEWA